MISSLAAVVVAVSAVSSGAHTVQWQAHYGQALAATRQDDRPLLVVLDIPGDPKTAVETEHLEIEGKQGQLLGAYQLCHVVVSTE